MTAITYDETITWMSPSGLAISVRAAVEVRDDVYNVAGEQIYAKARLVTEISAEGHGVVGNEYIRLDDLSAPAADRYRRSNPKAVAAMGQVTLDAERAAMVEALMDRAKSTPEYQEAVAFRAAKLRREAEEESMYRRITAH